MMAFVYYLFLLTLSLPALCQEQCLKKYQNMNATDINLNEYCNDPHKPCIIKCCGGNDQMFYNFTDTEPYGLACNSTELYKVNIDMQNITFTGYKNDIKTNIEKVTKNISEYKLLVDTDIDCENMYTDYSEMNLYLLENGILMLEWPNHYERWFEKPQYSFCFDYVVDIENETVITDPYIRFGVFTADELEIESPNYDTLMNKTLYAAIGLLISCFFLILVLLAYAILPDLHTTAGLVLMASVATQICAFLILGIEYIKILQENVTSEFCENMRYPKYYFFLSTIFWVTAQSFEAWTIITHKKFTNKPCKEKILKVFLYGLFAWGTPALMTIGVKVVHEMDLSSIPWFIKPHIDMTCYFGDIYSLLLYQDVPIMILLGFNLIFYILSVRQLLKLNKWKRKQNSEKKTRFWFHVKLSLVMGLNWLLYVIVSYLPPEMNWFSYICDTYNLFSGVAIFFFFVVQKRVLRLLNKKIFLRQGLTSNTEHKDKFSKTTEYMENNITCNEMALINNTI